MQLNNKNIILGVCGSIAAYKSATLVRLLVKAGANVKIVLTHDAAHFITPLTLATLSKNSVEINYFDEETGVWANHVELGLWADLMIIAPASANTISKFSNGLCDNLLTAVYLSAKCPVYIAPAMDLDMWKHSSTVENIQKLKSYGNIVITPGTGELASGLFGEGRMEEPDEIVKFIDDHLRAAQPLYNLNAVVTAGPTYEAIDPVRFIGNHSSGKMGIEIAKTLKKLGANVTLITGPTTEKSSSINRIDVVSAQEMLEACLAHAHADIFIMSAAVADYTPADPAKEKIKKNDTELVLHLKKTTDILATLGKNKPKNQILVGFALETYNEENFALEKLEKKNLDLIVLNSTKDPEAGFKKDTNKITIFNKLKEKTVYEAKSKSDVAVDICNQICKLIPSK